MGLKKCDLSAVLAPAITASINAASGLASRLTRIKHQTSLDNEDAPPADDYQSLKLFHSLHV